MSVEPKSSDSLQQLKELMLGDEQRELAALRARVEGMDAASVERLAHDLVEALRRRKQDGGPAFSELVEALQPGTEAAIQRSVSVDKSRLSKALFPIMGPAIRNYVVDLFRGMVEELNETIRNTTSANRIKWRIQARLAGKSYSEFVMLKTRSFRVEEVYLMQRETGLLLMHAETDPKVVADGEADLVSGMLTAIRSFVRDSFASGEDRDDESKELDGFNFGEREVLIEVGPSMMLAAVSLGVPPPSTRDDLKEILEDLHQELQGTLDRFAGDTSELEPARPTLRRALLENRAAPEADGGLWRAWLFLGVIGLGLAAWWTAGYREQREWNRFEEALRAEPGVAVTGVDSDGWWRKRRVTGLRDPLAADPAALAEAMGIDPANTTLEFGLMESLDPAFAGPREEREEESRRTLLAAMEDLKKQLDTVASREKLDELSREWRAGIDSIKVAAETATAESRRQIEALVRSEFGDVDGLAIDWNEEGVRLSGFVPEPIYSSVLARVKPLESLARIDVADLKNGSVARLAELESAIAETTIRYADGTLDSEDDRQISRLADLTRELDDVARALGLTYRFVVEAHPLIGDNREGNRRVEQARADQALERLVERGVPRNRIESRLSEDRERAGEGISLRSVPAGGKEEE